MCSRTVGANGPWPGRCVLIHNIFVMTSMYRHQWRQTIDISWLDRAYKSSTCDVMYCIVDNAAIYIMVVKFRNTTWPPPPQFSLHRRAALSSHSYGTRSYIADRTKTQSIYYKMSVRQTEATVDFHIEFRNSQALGDTGEYTLVIIHS
jgi:hypothetical protein